MMKMPARGKVRSRRAFGGRALLFAAVDLALVSPATAQFSAQHETELDARVARANEWASLKLIPKILNTGLTFHWIGAGDRLWYRKAMDQTHSSFMLVDAASGAQQPLFDSSAMASALARAGAPAFAREALDVASVSADGHGLVVSLPEPGASCRWPVTPRCEKPVLRYRCDLPVSACQAIPLPPDRDFMVSPDGRRGVFVRDHDLWLRVLASGAEKRLTFDGVAQFAYGTIHLQSDDFLIPRRRAGQADPVNGIVWSPDGRHLLALRHDLRQIPDRLQAIEYVPPDGTDPVIHTTRKAIAADLKYPDATLDVIDVDSGAVHRTDIDPQSFSGYSVVWFNTGHVWWTADDRAWVVTTPRAARKESLVSIDLATGHTREVIQETALVPLNANTRGDNAPNMAVLASGREAIWFSERDDWGHLYLYDTVTGRVKRRLTQGPWLVADLLRVDEKTRTAYFTALGREAGQDPYYHRLYSVSLDGGTPKLLTPENADHDFENRSAGPGPGGSFSPDGRYFIDSFSTVSQPDQAVIRTINGQETAHVVTGDASALASMGWRPPERFTVKAADGKTDLWGAIITPHDFDPTKKYPVIEVTYPGPQSSFSPTQFRDDFLASNALNAYAFAETGAVVIALDGRGTANRQASFHNAFIGSDDARGAIDHDAGIRHAAATRPFMDLSRVGSTGHSYGGYGSMREMLMFPDLFKVVVAGGIPGDFLTLPLDVATERLYGVPDNPATIAYYHRISNEALVDRLQGKLMLVFAAADEDVPLQNGVQLFSALQKAGKTYDTLIVADAPHYGGREPYGVTRTIRYFADNLGGPR